MLLNLLQENLNIFHFRVLLRRYEEHRPDNINSVSARPAKTDHVEQQKIGLWQPEALYHQSQNGIVMHSDEASHPERSILRPRSRVVAQPTAPGSPRSGFPGKSSWQPFSQSKFKQPSGHRDVSSDICLIFNKRYRPNCELSLNKCKYGHHHVCQVCSNFGCKKVNHQPISRQTDNIHDKSVCQPQVLQAYTSTSVTAD